MLAAANAPAPFEAPIAPPPSASAEISVLTYNVRGLPWPLAHGRADALRTIGEELSRMRTEGRQPDVVLIQEGFRGEVAELVALSGYRYWAGGPARADKATGAAPADGHRYIPVRHPLAGEGWGKVLGGGLHVLSDAPILDVRTTPYRYCAGLDCLANKGAMLARIALPGAPAGVDVINTHLNSKRAARAPLARSLQAHNLQTEELLAFIADHRTEGAPLLVGGDFNVRNAPARYDHMAGTRPFKVVSEFCNAAEAACEGQAPAADKPWLKSQDLQAFADGVARLRPVKVSTVFDAASPQGRLSDHDGYMVRYRMSWDPTLTANTTPLPAPLQVRPQMMKTWGVKVSWKY